MIGPVPKFEEMVDFDKTLNGNKKKSENLYSSLFRKQEMNSAIKQNSNELKKQSVHDQKKEIHLSKFQENDKALNQINES